MRKFAQTTVVLAEADQMTPRAEWGFEPGRLRLNDHDLVVFSADDSQPGLYIADSGGDFVFAGRIDEVPATWLDEKSIRFFFGLSLDQFKQRFSPGNS